MQKFANGFAKDVARMLDGILRDSVPVYLPIANIWTVRIQISV